MKYFRIVIEHVQKAMRPFYALLAYPHLLVGGANAGPAGNIVKFPKPLKPSLFSTQGIRCLRRDGEEIAVRKISDGVLIAARLRNPIALTPEKQAVKQPRQQFPVVKEVGAAQPANVIYANFKGVRQKRPERVSQANG